MSDASAPVRAVTYLDHAATTPVLDHVIEAMASEWSQVGNPSSLHGPGRRARRIVEEARESLAADLGASPADVIFTSGGTEANNLAVKGLFRAARHADPRRTRVLASSIEHHAVLDPVQWLADADGAEVEWLPVDAAGCVRLDALEAALARDPESVAVVSVMWANNEVGTVQPVAEVARLCAAAQVPLHVDAVQAVPWEPVRFDLPGVTALTVSGHKVGGPMGVGALLIDPRRPVEPLLHGGGQERDVRSGTLDAPAIHGLALAVRDAVTHREERSAMVAALRDQLISLLAIWVPDVVINGPAPGAGPRLAHVVHASFPGCDGDALLMLLDAAGVACSTGSACSAGVPRPSHVLLAMGVDPVLARSSLRFSLGRTSTAEDIEALGRVLPAVVERARRAGQVGVRSA